MSPTGRGEVEGEKTHAGLPRETEGHRRETELDLEPEEPAEILAELLEEVAEAFGLDVRVRIEQGDGVLMGVVEGEDVGLLIGRKGQTIDALQHLAQRIVFRGGSPDMRVAIDADGYRERRTQSLEAIALDAVEETLRSGQPVELEPMAPSERRIIHEYLRERGGVQTHSEGQEPDRYLVVEPLVE